MAASPAWPAPRTRRVRLLIIDDSATTRAVISRVVAAEADMEITGRASTAEQALNVLGASKFDVILLDLHMPGRGGLDALPEIISAAGSAQILVVSTLTYEGAEATMQALSLGAADTLAKPQPGAFDDSYRSRLVEKIRTLGCKSNGTSAPDGEIARTALQAPRLALRRPKILAIGASTGGIHALGAMLAAMRGPLNAPIVITQHLPDSFMEAFARQMQIASGRIARVATEGALLVDDEIWIAPGQAHLTVVASGAGQCAVHLDRRPAASGCMPSVDPMFASVARTAGARGLGVILSGMGRDGTAGAKDIVDAGGAILVQDEPSSAVWGMPGSAAVAGLAAAILPPQRIGERVMASAASQ